MGKLSVLNVLWKGGSQSVQEFEEGVREQLLNNDVRWANWAEVVLDLLLRNEKNLLKNGITNGTLGYSGYETGELKILRGVRKGSSRVQTLDLKRTDLVWCERAQGSCQILKDNLLQAQEQTILILMKMCDVSGDSLAKHRTYDRAAVQKNNRQEAEAGTGYKEGI